MIKVAVLQDYDWHWYIIPIELVHDFYDMLGVWEDTQDRDWFIDKYDKYRTMWWISEWPQLYAEI